LVVRALDLTEAEEAFIAHIAPHVGGTPRRALRFLNVYRVIKASLGAQELELLEKRGGYRGLMTQLAIAIGSPLLLQQWIGLLDAEGTGGNLINSRDEIMDSLDKEKWFTESPERIHLDGAIGAFWSGAQSYRKSGGVVTKESPEAVRQMLQNGTAYLKDYGALAKRYSFGV
jgi:hypothetical protein